MKKSFLPLAISAALSLVTTAVFANETTIPAPQVTDAPSKIIVGTDTLAGIDFFGYFRSGMGASDGGGSMKNATGGSFEKNKLGRLGNEFDTYAEVGFGKELYNSGSQSVYMQTMINMYDGDTNSDHTNKFGWENMNIQFRNFMGMGETTWAGIRQYNKYSIDANDFFFWNQTNTGGGIEKMDLGQGKASVAVLHRDISENETDIANGGDPTIVTEDLIDSNQIELMYDSQPLWDGATLAVGYKYLNADPNDKQIERANHGYSDGQTAMIMLTQQVLDKGVNNTVIQYYGKGSALQGVTFGAADTLNGTVKEGEGWAIRNYGSIPLAADWDLSHALNYAVANDVELWNGDKGDASTAAVSAKVTYHWSDYTRTYLEMGYFGDKKTVNGTDYDRSGAKYTLAQALSYGRDKPELRVFVSHYDSDKDNWAEESQSFNNGLDNDTWAVGIQANVFW